MTVPPGATDIIFRKLKIESLPPFYLIKMSECIRTMHSWSALLCQLEQFLLPYFQHYIPHWWKEELTGATIKKSAVPQRASNESGCTRPEY